jgi:hypothetical protein
MGRKIEMVGRRFWRWLVLSQARTRHYNKGPVLYYKVRCRCGTVSVINGGSLRSGVSKSCGCFKREFQQKRMTLLNFKHGAARRSGKTSEYGTWKAMRERCRSRRCKDYKDYGGRGITVCARWRDSFQNFLADMGRRPKGKSLDRIDNDGNYKPSNCQWTTHRAQMKNRRPQRRRYSS